MSSNAFWLVRELAFLGVETLEDHHQIYRGVYLKRLKYSVHVGDGKVSVYSGVIPT